MKRFLIFLYLIQNAFGSLLDYPIIFSKQLYNSNAVFDTIPSSVSCTKVKRCTKKGVCILVCDRGSVVLDPWLEHALWTQRTLTYTQSLCHVQLPGSHNSAITFTDGYGSEDHIYQTILQSVGIHDPIHTNNQLFSVTDQLRMGVRFIEIDVHWFNDDLHIAHCGNGAVDSDIDQLIDTLHHAATFFNSHVRWDTKTIGCQPSMSGIPPEEQRRVEDGLLEIAIWLHAPANQREFLFIFLDDDTSLEKWNKVDVLLGYVRKHFDSKEIFLPSDVPTNGVMPTVEDLILRGKRIMFLSGVDYSSQMNSLFFHKSKVCNWSEPNLPLQPYPSCKFLAENEAFIGTNRLLRPQTSEIQYGPLNSEGKPGENENLLDETTLPMVMQCGVNLPSPDNLTPARMASMVWSWEKGEPSQFNGCTVLDRKSQKWKSHNCQSSRFLPPACKQNKKNQPLWTLGKPTDACYAHEACPQGTRFEPPVNGYENALLVELLNHLGEQSTWINFRRDGCRKIPKSSNIF